ncbi:MAG: glycine zipper 2TM domain-containing protein [Thiomargarita sp.]|nr:glycine zipper 2TM domain-containing protein [Thiomargarita sp.]
MNTKIICLCAAVTMSLGACQATMPSNETIGAVGGGAAGAIIGSRFGGGSGQHISIAVGTLLGVFAGSAIGSSMEQTDVTRTQQVLNTTPPGEPVAWTNANTQTQYTVTPISTFKNTSGQDCRTYNTVAVIDQKRETLQGEACRQLDGNWKAIDQKK